MGSASDYGVTLAIFRAFSLGVCSLMKCTEFYRAVSPKVWPINPAEILRRKICLELISPRSRLRDKDVSASVSHGR
jgi:hypothetical protein